MWCGGRVFIQRENIVAVCSTLYSSLIIVISLQCNSVDVGKLPNYVNTILCVWLFFFGVCFLYFFVSHRLGIRFNSLHADSHSIDILVLILLGRLVYLWWLQHPFCFWISGIGFCGLSLAFDVVWVLFCWFVEAGAVWWVWSC